MTDKKQWKTWRGSWDWWCSRSRRVEQ